ncbi:hypothetical protein B0H34DRAFT_161853 [Crassisporium funariophilum]|nr:hypothetical protein B0H34DRAFT_161853 [Crassisporium funariophilum]
MFLESSSMLPLKDYERYGRQMILEDFGLPGQLKLHSASVVVVGAGGLGCPALQYLGASGIGRIGIVDHDRVELSNLQRQILHTEEAIGMFKADSAALTLKRTNSNLNIDVIPEALTAENALSILRPYDVILDCTDNSPTRYLLSDAAVALRKPLVSGAAQKFEGQLCVYNLGVDGPCYRCIFPTPPPKETMGSCEELGILGVVTGIIGNMQALEAIKIIIGLHDEQPSMLLFSATVSPPFRSIKLRPRKSTCLVCSNPDASLIPRITNTDYVQFCGGPLADWLEQGLETGDIGHRTQAKDLKEVMSARKAFQIIDVRPHTEYGICQLPGSLNVPLKDLLVEPEKYLPTDPEIDTYVVCRLGNDSQIAAASLRKVEGHRVVKDVIGGLRAWTTQVDSNFPVY